jgi:putative restriction endonuclease
MSNMDNDTALRLTAFGHINRLTAVRKEVASATLAEGFEFEGQRIPLTNPQRGIFKPRQMRYLLSIKTVFPKSGAKVWYDDQRRVHSQIYEEEESVEYAFMGQDPEAADNQWMKEAFERSIPIIYFMGVAPGIYRPLLPCFICDWNPRTLKARVAFKTGDELYPTAPSNAAERRYALREVQQRMHQSSFREAVISAYGERCALSGLPEPLLLDAAHIISDKHESLGQPVVPNGIPLSKIHHAAFDAHLIGIDPDFKIHVSERLLDQNDGPMLAALKQLHGGSIIKPRRELDYPDRNRLALRFEQFRSSN